ncbi:CHAT domain-containing protein [Fodinibius sp.]|uniref:CHAT domain-containing protein n=1 Tax=Fodinibius sp. TaxID=1872440 RepID=UPI002ACEDF03|nr:CHAT domain-containing protein [Fodinibius sp.]MDZ7659079.1 CHAT domain-containing protein [Fodinibius sp.]
MTAYRGIFLSLILLLTPLLGWGQERMKHSPAGEPLLQKGDSLQHAARYDSSTHYYHQAADFFEEHSDIKGQRDAFFQISLNKADQDDLMAAATFLEEAWGLSAKNFPDDNIFKLRYYHQKGVLAEAKAEYQTALDWYQKGLALADSVEDGTLFRVRMNTGIGEVYSSEGNYKQAITQFSDAQNTYHRSGLEDQALLSRIYNGRGTAHQKMGQNKQALKFFRLALEIDKDRLPDPHPELSILYNNMSLVYYYQSDYQRALEYMMNATNVLASFHGKNHRLVAAGYNNIGVVYSQMGEMEQAAKYLEKSLEIKEKVLGSNHPEVAVGYQNLGATYSDIEQYDKAITYYQKSKNIYQKRFPDGHPELANVYANLGQAYEKKEAYNKALDFYFQDLDINRRMLSPNHPFIGDTYSKIGKTYAGMGNYQQALNYYRQAMKVLLTNYRSETPFQELSLENVVYPELLLNTLRFKGEALYEAGNQNGNPKQLEQSLQTYLQAVGFIDELQRSLDRDRSKFLLRERTVDIYRKGFKTAHTLLQQTGDTDYKHHLFHFAQKSRNQILLEQIQKLDNQKFAQIPDSLIERENKLRASITDFQQQLSGFTVRGMAGDSLTRISLQDSLFHAQKSLQNHIQKLESSYPKYYGLKFKPPVAKISEIQQNHLTPSQTLVSYFFGQESLYALVISRESFEIQEINADSLLDKTISNFRNTILETTSVDTFANQSHRLYQQLIDPITDYITGQNLLIIPSGPLHYLPFETLLTQPISDTKKKRFHKLPYLINKYNISYAPSVGYLELRAHQKISPKKKTLAAFAPDFKNITASQRREVYPGSSRPISPLLFNKIESQYLEKLFNRPDGFFSFLKSKKDEADLFVDEEATESTFKQASLNQYRYIHLATHAFLQEEQPEQSGILFSPADEQEDGMLYVSEIYNLQLQSDLVTLSACNTGMGKLKKGEGVIGLSRAFLYAGARNLLVSLWRVSDRSTAQLMRNFYARHHDGVAMPKALQKAKQMMINQAEYAHPKYWAPFVFIGQ